MYPRISGRFIFNGSASSRKLRCSAVQLTSAARSVYPLQRRCLTRRHYTRSGDLARQPDFANLWARTVFGGAQGIYSTVSTPELCYLQCMADLMQRRLLPICGASSWATRDRTSLIVTTAKNVVQMDTQAAILELPSRDALVRLGGNMSLHRDPSAPSATKIDPAIVDRDPEFQDSQRALNNQRTQIIKCFGSIKALRLMKAFRELS
jgi:hypothetical protein